MRERGGREEKRRRRGRARIERGGGGGIGGGGRSSLSSSSSLFHRSVLLSRRRGFACFGSCFGETIRRTRGHSKCSNYKGRGSDSRILHFCKLQLSSRIRHGRRVPRNAVRDELTAGICRLLPRRRGGDSIAKLRLHLCCVAT